MDLIKTKSAYKVYSLYLIWTLVLTLIGSVVGTFLPIGNGFLIGYGIVSLFLSIALALSEGKTKKILLNIFCFGEGLFLSPLANWFSPNLLVYALMVTVFITILAMIVGSKIKYSKKFGQILYTILWVGFIYTLLCMFFPLPAFSILFVILFTAYIAYDISLFKEEVKNYNGELSTDEIIDHVTMMYLNILNLFLRILEFLAELSN